MTAKCMILQFIIPLGAGLAVGFIAYAIYPHGGVMAFVGGVTSMVAGRLWNWR